MLKKRIISSLLVLSILVMASPYAYATENPSGEITPAPDITVETTGSEEGGHSPPILHSGDPPVITEDIIIEEAMDQEAPAEPHTGDPDREAPSRGIIEGLIDLIPDKDQSDDYIEDGLLSDTTENRKEDAPVEPEVATESAITTEPAIITSESVIEFPAPAPVYEVLFQDEEEKTYSSEADFILVNNSGQNKTYRIKSIENIGLSPYVVDYDKYSEREWRNLNTEATLNNVSIGFEIDGEQLWYDGNEADVIYMAAGSTANVKILFQHGSSWPEAFELGYKITLCMVEKGGDPETMDVVSQIEKTDELQAGESENQIPEPFNDIPAVEAGQGLPEEGAIKDYPLPDQGEEEMSAQTDLPTGGNPSLDPDQISPDSGPGSVIENLEITPD